MNPQSRLLSTIAILPGYLTPPSPSRYCKPSLDLRSRATPSPSPFEIRIGAETDPRPETLCGRSIWTHVIPEYTRYTQSCHHRSRDHSMASGVLAVRQSASWCVVDSPIYQGSQAGKRAGRGDTKGDTEKRVAREQKKKKKQRRGRVRTSLSLSIRQRETAEGCGERRGKKHKRHKRKEMRSSEFGPKRR